MPRTRCLCLTVFLSPFRHYELWEDTLALICEADNSAHQSMRKVEGGWRDEGGDGTGGKDAVAGASNYSAINNPRVTRVIGPLSLHPPRRSLAFLPSWQPNPFPPPPKVSMLAVRQRDCSCVSGAFIASGNPYRSIVRQGPLMRRIATTRSG